MNATTQLNLKRWKARLWFFHLLLVSGIVFGGILLAAPPDGYYSTATGSGAALKTRLHDIIRGHTAKDYGYLWTAYLTTDKRSDGKVWDMYSDVPGGTPAYSFTFGSHQCGNYDGEGDCYNREHSFPKSWFNDASPMKTDLFHVVPTDGYVNGKRDNYPFGEVQNPSWTSTNGSKVGSCSTPGYSGTVFEPIDAYKGDFARSYFYMATRYENLIAGWYNNFPEADAVLQNNNFPVYETWFLEMLGRWHVQDPVSTKEIARNDAIYEIQGNRNPFIDHPEYVYSIWGVGETEPTTPPNPTRITIGRSVDNNSILDFGTVSSTATKSFEIKSATLTSDLNVAITGVMFSSSVTTIARSQAASGFTLTLTFTPTVEGTHQGTLTISGGGLATPYTFTLTGKR